MVVITVNNVPNEKSAPLKAVEIITFILCIFHNSHTNWKMSYSKSAKGKVAYQCLKNP